jgi:hypothetical protein
MAIPERLPPRLERAGFAALVAAHVAPIWALGAFLTQDGPAHVYNAFVLFHAGEAPFREHFAVHGGLQSNWASHLLLGALLAVASPTTAEKIVATACVVLAPVAFRRALAVAAPRAPRELSWAAVPFAAPHALYMGFWNFSLAAGLYWLALAAFWRFRGRPRPRRGAAFGLALLAGALCHPLPLAHAAFAIAALLAFECGAAARRRPRAARRVLAAGALRAIRTAAWALPAAALVAAASMGRGGETAWRPFARTIHDAAALWPLVIHRRIEQWPAIAIWVVIAAAIALALARRARRRVGPGDGWLAAAAAALAAALAAPNETSGGGLVTERLLLFPWPLAIVWLGREAARRRATGRAGVAVALAALALLALRWPVQRRIDGMLRAYRAAAARVPAGSTVLALTLVRGGKGPPDVHPSFTVSPFLHAIGYDAVERRLVDLQDYEARTAYFPVEARPATREALARFHAAELPGACVDFGGPGRLRPDAVLVFGPAMPGALCDEVEAELARSYALAYGAHDGPARVYVREVASR